MLHKMRFIREWEGHGGGKNGEGSKMCKCKMSELLGYTFKLSFEFKTDRAKKMESVQLIRSHQ